MVRAFLWYVAVVAIALGSAGLIVQLDHPATAGKRPELTARGNAIVAAALPDLRRPAVALSTEVGALSRAAGESLGALAAGDATLAREEMASGSTSLVGVSAAVADLRGSLAALEEALRSAPIDDAQRTRLDALEQAFDAADGLPATWQGFTAEAMLVADLLDAGSDTGEVSTTLVEGLLGIDRVRGVIAEAVAALD